MEIGTLAGTKAFAKKLEKDGGLGRAKIWDPSSEPDVARVRPKLRAQAGRLNPT